VKPEELSPAERKVHEVICSDPDLAAITRDPAWLARDLLAAAPLVDVAHEVRSLAAYLRQNRKRYTDGNAYLLRNVSRKQRDAAERAPAPAPPREVRAPHRTPPVPPHIARAAERDVREGRVPKLEEIMRTLEKLGVPASERDA
jgi:type IV secretory pathway VirB10-like protein